MRGYARFPFSLLAQTGQALASRLARRSADPRHSVLVCTTPFFAPVAELWEGPVVYWLSDLIAMYGAASYESVRDLDRRMCRAATLVCPNSERIADYLRNQAQCPTDRCHILPNATGVRSLLGAPTSARPALPEPYPLLQHPVAGVIGNLAENTDWVFLEQLIRLTPWLHWLFVGSADLALPDVWQRSARHWVRHHERALFIGPQPYTELYRFARAIEVAVLPYRLREPTFSGSSTRFYDHLAAGHPLLATTAVHSLRGQAPLVHLVETAEEAAQVLATLRENGFEDDQREARWHASQQNTWRERARRMQSLLQTQLTRASGSR